MTDRLWVVTKIMYRLMETKFPDYTNPLHMQGREMAEEELRGKSMKQLQAIAKKMNVVID